MELWDIYDKNRVSTGRTHVRGEEMRDGDFHLVVLIWIINSKGEILITKRHPEKPWPLMWECTGGSVLKGEDSSGGALREVKEEIGVNLDIKKGKMIHTHIREDSIYDTWVFFEDIDLSETRLQEREVVDITYVTAEKLKHMLEEGIFVPTLGYFTELLETHRYLKNRGK